jgi:hypothetical protein
VDDAVVFGVENVILPIEIQGLEMLQHRAVRLVALQASIMKESDSMILFLSNI